MKISVPILVAAVVLSSLIGFFIGRNYPANQVANQKTEIASIQEGTNAQKIASKESIDSQTPAVPEEKEEPEAKPEKTIDSVKVIVPDELSSNPIPSGGVVLARTPTGISDKKIGSILSNIAENLEKKKLAYVSKLSQDCSGIFHQLKDSLQKRIPALAKGPSYQYPEYKNIRSSRQIANWFHSNGNLLIVEDPLASKNSIRPGSVMFYGKPNKKYKNMTIETLTDKKNNFTSNGAIMHIAVVTAVTTDENGDVVDYTIMHGRNKRVHASRSGSKEVQSKRTKGLPAFGNWTQQWVAVANIVTKK